ncbi:Tfp pilus assembly protein FimT/FimU [Desulfopila sp. IMCC35008]|uniref:pilus assembly FimT family protein n=1 Tax=Desulfopila sp. IMCC35008 TaxID=2653858 RepID=UPI0013D89B11|nr:prepilin-type N-terminal cleavage/methylation domain-containing protein [Desulfopila sp. IMCC35008]
MSPVQVAEKGTQPTKQAAGFSLLELIVVCALMGLLLMTGVPAFRQALLDDSLRSDSRKLIGYIKTVREKGLREQRAYLLFLDLAENRVYHRLDNPEKPENDKEPELEEKSILHLADEVTIRDFWNQSGGIVDTGLVEIWISRQGYLDRSIIHLENKDGDGVSLLLSPFVPDIEVRDGYYEPEK